MITFSIAGRRYPRICESQSFVCTRIGGTTVETAFYLRVIGKPPIPVNFMQDLAVRSVYRH